ncbi:MAG TPA: ADP-ribosylglycohydrolase family protein [Flexivirga sp.]|uniref:ADP-ribosylglycohydrolase family protein n=1 Tax=Flexivirga sp. TaxID=1962927 RepID=UPI002CE9EBF3|nr:ADP-ribosylglycohydrolase family protein [Flexivirga sp.]HWC23854.1 ADP-ribosylglycohydrolase family protein [Flexivirga sp.]
MQLSPVQKDRAAGVLLGQAIGDALGVPYEFKPPIAAGAAFMTGGGLGPYSPGEWSDDTQMAVCIAQVSASGGDLTGGHSLADIAKGFYKWRHNGASDIGNQTRAVIDKAALMIGGAAMDASMSKWELDTEWFRAFQQAAADYSETHPKSAGNGALMRNGIVGLTRLANREATAAAALAVAALTHADPLVGASCVLHAEAVRVAVIEGRLDIRAGLDLLADDERVQWGEWIDEAEREDPKSFKDNGFTVTAFQAAWSAIFHTMCEQPTPDHVNDALQLAISIGHDTDTVAAIAGALLGARYGVSGLRHDWRQQVHGWPGLDAHDLIRLGLQTAMAGVGQPILDGKWPSIATTGRESRTLGVQLPADPGVVLGTEADLPRVAELGCDAAVSLSRLGTDDRRPTGVTKHLEQWLVDREDPADNGDLAWALHDSADAVRDLRDSAEQRVLLHCARAEHRTPAVALLYAVKHCHQPPTEAANDIRKALGRSVIDGLLWRTAMAEAAAVECQWSPQE